MADGEPLEALNQESGMIRFVLERPLIDSDGFGVKSWLLLGQLPDLSMPQFPRL